MGDLPGALSAYKEATRLDEGNLVALHGVIHVQILQATHTACTAAGRVAATLMAPPRSCATHCAGVRACVGACALARARARVCVCSRAFVRDLACLCVSERTHVRRAALRVL